MKTYRVTFAYDFYEDGKWIDHLDDIDCVVAAREGGVAIEKAKRYIVQKYGKPSKELVEDDNTKTTGKKRQVVCLNKNFIVEKLEPLSEIDA